MGCGACRKRRAEKQQTLTVRKEVARTARNVKEQTTTTTKRRRKKR